MDEIFSVIDGRFRVSIADSTMMWIVHHAMDKAHERVKSKEGVLERLNEISKFYELAVMQLEGCLKFVQNETDHNHEEVLAGLTEIRNRLQRRLHESELAIIEKDRELAERLENEVMLRQTLEFKERELLSLKANLEQAVLVCGDNDGDDEVYCIGQKPKADNKSNEDKFLGFDDEMGSDIDILKEKLDLAFERMQNAIFLSEIGPIEHQLRSSVENDTLSILLEGFMRDFKDNFEAEMRNKQNQSPICLSDFLSDFINEVTRLHNDLEPLICKDDMQTRGGEKRPIAIADQILDEGSDHHVAKMIKSHESIIRKKSAEAEELNRLKQEILIRVKSAPLSYNREKGFPILRRRLQEVMLRLENLMDWNSKVKMGTLQLGSLMDVENKTRQGSTKEDSDLKSITTQDIFCCELHDYELESLLYKTIDKEFISDIINQWNEVVESNAIESHIREEINTMIFRENFEKWSKDVEDYMVESYLREETSRIVSDEAIKNVINTINEFQQTKEIVVRITTDIYTVFLCETIKEWEEKIEAYNMESMIQQEIHHVIFNEAKKDVLNQDDEKDKFIIQDENDMKEDQCEEDLKVSVSSEVMLTAKDKENFVSKENEEGINTSIFVYFSRVFEDFECRANEKLGIIMLRLEEMKDQIEQLTKVMASLKEKELLYRKAFISRCQNLYKAETEVDLLGDQVDLLVGLLEKTYSLLNHHSPVMHQYSEVTDMLQLIKKEIGGCVNKPTKVTKIV